MFLLNQVWHRGTKWACNTKKMESRNPLDSEWLMSFTPSNKHKHFCHIQWIRPHCCQICCVWSGIRVAGIIFRKRKWKCNKWFRQSWGEALENDPEKSWGSACQPVVLGTRHTGIGRWPPKVSQGCIDTTHGGCGKAYKYKKKKKRFKLSTVPESTP